MKDNKPHIDNLFEEKLGSRSFDFDERQWEKMAAVLDRQKRWGRIKLFSVLALLISASTFITYNSFQPSSDVQRISASNNTGQIEKLIPQEPSVDKKETIVSNEIPESENVSETLLDAQLDETRHSSVQETIDKDASSTKDASSLQHDQTSDQTAIPSKKMNEEYSNKPNDVDNLSANNTLILTSAGQLDEIISNESVQTTDEGNKSNTNTELSVEPPAVPMVASKSASAPLNNDDEQSFNKEETNSLSEAILASTDVPLQAQDVEDVMNKRKATSSKESSNASLTPITDVRFSKDLTDMNDWDPLTLKTLNSPSVQQKIIQPEAQTTEPYSTHVNKAYKLTYGIRAGVGLGSYSNDSEENGSSSSTAIYAGGFGAFQIHRRIIVDAGVSYAYQDISMNTRIYHNISYDFYQRDVQQQLFVNQLHILEFPLYITYKINPSHLVSIGAKFNYLMAVEGESISTEIYGDQITPLNTEKFTEANGILEELNWSLGFAYDYQFNPMFRIGLGADIGLNDWKMASEFDDNQSFINHQLRLRLTYLIKK